MQDKTSPRIRKLTQNSSFVQEDKNLLQSNGHSRNCEIPIDGYFGNIASSDIGINPVFPIFAASHRKSTLCDRTTNETYLFDYLLYRGDDGLNESQCTDP